MTVPTPRFSNFFTTDTERCNTFLRALIDWANERGDFGVVDADLSETSGPDASPPELVIRLVQLPRREGRE